MSTVTLEGFDTVDKQLAKLSVISRGSALKKGMAKAGQLVARRAKELVPVGDEEPMPEGRKRLKDTIGYVVREYDEVIMAIIGHRSNEYWRSAKHGHLVEFGHRMVVGGSVVNPTRGYATSTGKDRPERRGTGRVVGFVQPTPYLGPASQDTQSQQVSAVVEGVDKFIVDALGLR